MKKILLFILLIINFISCEPSAVGEGRKAYKAYFGKVLKDPQSFVVYGEKYKLDGNVAVEWDLDYGAKNELGGMVRKNVSFKTIGTSIWIDKQMYEYEDLK